jgi:protein-tyrosine kinase
MERISRALEIAKAQTRTNLYFQDNDGNRNSEQDERARSLISDMEVFALQADQLANRRIVAWNKKDQRTLAFDLLRTKLLREMQVQGWRTLAVTAAAPGCGATTIAINLAWSMAQQASPEVTLVDFNLRTPKVADYLSIHPKADLSDYLQGRGTLSTCIAKVGDLIVRVMPTLRCQQNAAELLGTPEAESLISRQKNDPAGRVTIFDLPPLLPTDDALVIVPRVDCVLLVLAENLTTKSETRAALNVLSGAHVIATVLNQSHVEGVFRVR